MREERHQPAVSTRPAILATPSPPSKAAVRLVESNRSALLPAGLLLDQLAELSTHGGERDATRLAGFRKTVASLREEPGATGAFRAKMASAAGWAALLFSSWRHLKYDRPSTTGADRVRAFIARDLLDARRLLRVDDGNSVHDPEGRIDGSY